MKKREIDIIADQYESEMMIMDGYNDCLVGVVERFGMSPIFCYSTKKIIAKLMKNGLSEGEAWEWFDFNQIGAWLGDGTPCFLSHEHGETK